MRQAGDAHVCHGDDIGRGSGGAGTAGFAGDDGGQRRVGGAQDDADEQRAAHEEDGETPVDRLEGCFDVDARAFGLAGDHGEVFGAGDAETCTPESSAEAFELAEGAGASVLLEGVVLPVAEAVGVALGVAAAHCDEGEGEDDQDEDDLGWESVCSRRKRAGGGSLAFPPDSQNSASPKTLMARTLRMLRM